MIYLTNYVRSKSVKISGLHYHELMGKIEERKGKYLAVEDYMLDKVLNKIKEIIENKQFANTKIFFC